jgi:formamidopyrimidine-DNA glycosylase
MPELPEVHTTVSGLQDVLPYLFIKDVWTDLTTTDKRNTDSVKHPVYFEYFKKEVTGKRIVNVSRRGKNILIKLEGGKTILIHMKMTGHLLFGRYDYNAKENTWFPHDKEPNQALRDPFNKYLHVVFTLKDPKKSGIKSEVHLAFSDSRKFGKMTLLETSELESTLHLSHIGPEPLEESFTAAKMIERLATKPNGKIKSVLMDQTVIAGIGNIYSDEILWEAGIHPEERVKDIPLPLFSLMFKAMKETLARGIDFGGDSMSDYRNIYGEPGKFQNEHNVYRRTGKPCKKKDGGTIVRKVVGGRSAHFCDVHQKLIKQK